MKSVVFVHAHPDDEALLSGGTLRALHQKGFRTVVIFLTNGERGKSEGIEAESLGNIRQKEAARSAIILGVSKTYFLEYSDSGLDSAAGRIEHSLIPVDEATNRIRDILERERPLLLVGYDFEGGYGHPDHKAVHRVVRNLELLEYIPTILEVTVDRTVVASTLERFRLLISLFEKLKIAQSKNIYELANKFSATADIAYAVDVRKFSAAKRSALKAHLSQTLGGVRNLRIMTMLPGFIFRYFFGKEWFCVIRDSDDNPIKTLI
ncbi:MAG: PIG-L deacetylase family protein [Candidatus Nanopelagicales bacterium]